MNRVIILIGLSVMFWHSPLMSQTPPKKNAQDEALLNHLSSRDRATIEILYKNQKIELELGLSRTNRSRADILKITTKSWKNQDMLPVKLTFHEYCVFEQYFWIITEDPSPLLDQRVLELRNFSPVMSEEDLKRINYCAEVLKAKVYAGLQ